MFYAQHKISAQYIVFTALDNQAQEKFHHQESVSLNNNTTEILPCSIRVIRHTNILDFLKPILR